MRVEGCPSFSNKGEYMGDWGGLVKFGGIRNDRCLSMCLWVSSYMFGTTNLDINVIAELYCSTDTYISTCTNLTYYLENLPYSVGIQGGLAL